MNDVVRDLGLLLTIHQSGNFIGSFFSTTFYNSIAEMFKCHVTENSHKYLVHRNKSNKDISSPYIVIYSLNCKSCILRQKEKREVVNFNFVSLSRHYFSLATKHIIFIFWKV